MHDKEKEHSIRWSLYNENTRKMPKWGKQKNGHLQILNAGPETSRSFSPLPFQRQKAILSLPSPQHSLSTPFPTSSCSLSSPQLEKRKKDDILSFSHSTQFFVLATSSSRSDFPLQFQFLGQINRQSLEQRETTEKCSKLEYCPMKISRPIIRYQVIGISNM